LGAVGSDRVGGLGGVGGNVQVSGCEDAERVLKSIYSDLKNRTSVTTEVVSGYDVALLANLVVPTTKENEDDSSLPIALYLAFDPEGGIEKLTIAAVDLHPLTEAIRSAAQSGVLQPSRSFRSPVLSGPNHLKLCPTALIERSMQRMEKSK
jgi:hypothetical protein